MTRLIYSAITLSLIAAPAAAQESAMRDRAGSSSMFTISGKLAYGELAEFGKCYAATSRNDSILLLSSPAGSAEEAKTYKHLFQKPYQSCLGNITEFRISHHLVRGAIAEGLYLKKIPVSANLAVAQVPAGSQVKNLSEAAICYAGNHRSAAQALVEGTKPGSEKEFKAISALWPDFSSCVPPKASAGVKLDVTLVRFRIAEALWRLGAIPGLAGGVQ
jgi:hypothetical protein